MYKLGDWVECSAYLVPARDGVRFDYLDADHTDVGRRICLICREPGSPAWGKAYERLEKSYIIHTSRIPDDEIVRQGEKAELAKTYYVRREKRFRGVVVGLKDVVTEGTVIADGTEYDDGFTFRKEPTNTVPCAIVCFAMGNKKRTVPICDTTPSDVQIRIPTENLSGKDGRKNGK